jgi:predicted secreted protein
VADSSSKVFVVLAVLAVITSLISIVLTYFSLQSFVGTLTGYATSTGETNLTVETQATINFTTDLINWGSGRVNQGTTAAALTSIEGSNNVTGGNWSLRTAGGLQLENTGNVNVTLNLTSTKTATNFIGGTSPAFKWNISDVERGSCLNVTGTGNGTLAHYAFYDVNTSSDSQQFCGKFRYTDATDRIRIDFNLTVPSDSTTGSLTSTITATALATT